MLYGMFINMSPERAAYMEIYNIDSGEIEEQANVMATAFEDQLNEWSDEYDITEVTFEGPVSFTKKFADKVKEHLDNVEVYCD